MSYAAHRKQFGSFGSHKAPSKDAAGSEPMGFWRRLYEAFSRSRQREIDRRLGAFIAQSGGVFTDEIEREMTRRLLTSNWSVNAGSTSSRSFP